MHLIGPAEWCDGTTEGCPPDENACVGPPDAGAVADAGRADGGAPLDAGAGGDAGAMAAPTASCGCRV
ncbi:MAG: hypothetical protein M3Y87_19650, partial [Myxococcota bacterium]|nr:hypothetical protein [Myxococcota bacterium]